MNKSTSQEPEKIKSMFAEVAENYDLTNNALTLGLAHLWRKKLVKLSKSPKNASVLDCATGTGDLALEFKKALGPDSKVVGIDFCKEMLDKAPEKAKESSLDIDFQIGDVMNLDFGNESFDTISIAYGIRNVADRKEGLKEMWRVLKKGGRLLILETGEGEGLLHQPVKFYTKYVTPFLGSLISKNKSAYSYLSNSSQEFPSKDEFLKDFDSFEDVKSKKYSSLLFGASYIYVIEKKS